MRPVLVVLESTVDDLDAGICREAALIVLHDEQRVLDGQSRRQILSSARIEASCRRKRSADNLDAGLFADLPDLLEPF